MLAIDRAEGSRRATIFLAAERGAALRSLRAPLEETGLRVVTVEDGIELLDRLGTSILGGAPAPAAIVCDDRLSGATGLGVLSGLRAAAWAVPFFLTGVGSADRAAQARRLGASAVFEAPVDLPAVRRSVLAVLDRSWRARA